jgi:hypothetical protein
LVPLRMSLGRLAATGDARNLVIEGRVMWP